MFINLLKRGHDRHPNRKPDDTPVVPGIAFKMTKWLPNKKNNCLLLEDKPDLRLVRTNYCVPGVMSHCSAGAVWNDQKRCKYAHKSTAGDRCMYYIEAIGGHCDCTEAQRELRKPVDRRKDWTEKLALTDNTAVRSIKKPPGSPHTTRGWFNYSHSETIKSQFNSISYTMPSRNSLWPYWASSKMELAQPALKWLLPMASNNHWHAEMIVSQYIDKCQEKILYVVYTALLNWFKSPFIPRQFAEVGKRAAKICINNMRWTLFHLFCAYGSFLTFFATLSNKPAYIPVY